MWALLLGCTPLRIPIGHPQDSDLLPDLLNKVTKKWKEGHPTFYVATATQMPDSLSDITSFQCDT